MATPVFLKLMIMALLQYIWWFLNLLLSSDSGRSQEKTEETLDLAGVMNQNLSASNSIEDSVPPPESISGEKKTDNPTTTPLSDIANANVSLTEIELQDLNKEMKEMDLSFQERVVTKDSSCDFALRDYDNDFDESSTHKAILDAENQSQSYHETDDEVDVTVLKVDRIVEDRVFKIQKSKPKKYRADEFMKKVAEEDETVEKESTKVMVECEKCKRLFVSEIIGRHSQFCRGDEDDED
jgi:hypothetical protein